MMLFLKDSFVYIIV